MFGASIQTAVLVQERYDDKELDCLPIVGGITCDDVSSCTIFDGNPCPDCCGGLCSYLV